MRRILAILFLAPLCSLAASWYVDPLAGGANNGTSWANAWNNPTNIVWASVSAGDTIYLSGGSTSQKYYDSLLMPSAKSGTLANPIVISHSPDANHNGLVMFSNATIAPSSTSYGVWVNGAKDSAFVAPTNNQQVVSGTTAVTNNCGFVIYNLIGTNQSDISPVVWYFNGGDNVRISYVEVYGLTNVPTATPGLDWGGSVCYVAQPAGEQTNVVFEYLWIHDNTTGQFQGGTPNNTKFDCYTFKLSWIYNNAEDCFEEGSGWTIRDSVIGPALSVGSKTHADTFQFTGSKIKIYNNVIYPSLNSISRLQTYPETSTADFWFFNNIIPEIPSHQNDGGTYNEAQCFVHFDPAHPGTNAWYTNIVFCNNTIYNSLTNTVQNVLSQNAWINFSKGALTNCFINNCLFVNNIFVDKNRGLSLPQTTNSVGQALGYATFTTNDFILDYNVLAATNTALTTPTNVSYLDYSGASWGQYLRHNKTNYPSWVDKANGNYELMPTDTVALNAGTNLSALFNFDNLNRARNVSGAWDIGALELQDTNLICWLTFDQSFTNWPDGRIDDQSGYGNHAYRWGNTNSVYPTNFPVAIYATNIAGANTNGYIAGDFRWLTNDYGLYGRWGQFAAVTNVSMFTNVANFSVMCWAHYANATRINPVYDYSVDGNATLISAGTSAGFVGSWDMGRYNQNIWLNNTRFQLMTNGAFTGSWGASSDPVYGGDGKVIFNYPDRGFDNNGETTVWHHYAMTFANGVAKSYYDGTNLATCDVSAITTHMTVGWNNYLTATRAFIGIGVDTHGGDPLLAPWDDFYAGDTGKIAYPNNGWMDGQIDDVRMYNRTLSASEIAGIVAGTGGGGGGGGGTASGVNWSRGIGSMGIGTR